MKRKTFYIAAIIGFITASIIIMTFKQQLVLSNLRAENLQLKCYAPACNNKALEIERQRTKCLQRLVMAQDNTINMLKGKIK